MDSSKRTCDLLGEARRELGTSGDGFGTNIAYVAVDRHVAEGRGERVAIRWLGKRGQTEDIRYRELAERASQFANALGALGIGQGDRVFLLAGRVPELYVTALGTLKNRSVLCPLFSAFGPEPIRTRLDKGSGRVLVTTEALYRKPEDGEGTHSWRKLVDRQSTRFLAARE